MEILTKENLVGAKAAPTAISRTFTLLLREPGFLSKDLLLPPRLRWKIVRRWGRGSKPDPEYFGGFQRGVFVRGGNLNNWGGARTGCNNYFCVKSL